jgi:membrane-bound lytic murein transglycosylase B
MKQFLRCVIILLAGLSASQLQAATLPGIPEFINKMVEKYHFDRTQLTDLFDQAQTKPKIIEAISRPPAHTPWTKYRAVFVNPNRIRYGLIFWKKYRQALLRAERIYGVPPEIIVALIGVETIYGQQMGGYRTLDALTTLAFDYPRRAPFFRDELENYLLLASEQQFNLLDMKGSYAGAMGIPQFMPSSYRKFAIDFNGNQKIDLLNEPVDAIGSVANYLEKYGWKRGEPIAARAQTCQQCCAGHEGSFDMTSQNESQDIPCRLLDFTVADGVEYWRGFKNFDVITRYNNSDYYAMSVFQLSVALKKALSPEMAVELRSDTVVN